MKSILSVIVSIFLLIVTTWLFVFVRLRIQLGAGTKAIGLPLVKQWTIYSPLYWLLVGVLIAAVWMLRKKWGVGR